METSIIGKFSWWIFIAIQLSFWTLPNGAVTAEKLTGVYAAQSISMSMPWIAQEAGLFRKHNLDFQLIYIPSGPAVTAALLGGDAGVSVGGGVSIVRALVQGATDLVFIGGVKNAFTTSIMASQKIKGLADLRGKKLGVSRIGSSTHYFAILALRRVGLDPARDITFIQGGGEPERLAALISGSVDAATLTPPTDARAIAQGFSYLAYGPDLRIPYAAVILVTRRSLITKQPHLVGQFMRVMAEAAKILHTNKEFTFKVLAKHLRVDDRKLLDASYDAEIKVLEPKLDIKMEALQAMIDEVSQTDPRARTILPHDLVDRRYLDDMEKTAFFANLWADRR
jgi:ABC-type nitrate/sulfonate/bicarbonate transport system substrate-binding protein